MAMGKLICEQLYQGEYVLRNMTTADGVNVGSFVRTFPGVGKPFWYWPSIPSGKVIAADFTTAPIVTTDAAANNALIAGITATPEDVLTYQTPTP